MAKQRGGNRTVIISIVVILAIVGIVIGVLFATGVLGKKSPSGDTPSKNHIIPGIPGVNEIPVSITLNQSEVIPNTPLTGSPFTIQYSLTYDRYVKGEQTLYTEVELIYVGGGTKTYKTSISGGAPPSASIVIDNYMQPNKYVSTAYLTAYFSYVDPVTKNTITGPKANSLQVNLPTKY